MKSLIASLRALTLPFGAGTGQRIVLDGVTGIISIYNAANQLVMEIEGSGITMYDGVFPRIQMDTASGSIFAYDDTGAITLRIDEAGLILYENAVEKVLLDAVTFPGIRVLTGNTGEDNGGALTASGVDSDHIRTSLVGDSMNGNGGFIAEFIHWFNGAVAPILKLNTSGYSGSAVDAYIDATAQTLAGNDRTIIAADEFWIGVNHGDTGAPTMKHSLPRGILDYKKLTTSDVARAAGVNSDSVINPTVDNTRLYRVHVKGQVTLGTASVAYVIALTDGGTVGGADGTDIDNLHRLSPGETSNVTTYISGSCLYTPAASGAKTLRIKNKASSGGTLALAGGVGNERHFWIEDIGSR